MWVVYQKKDRQVVGMSALGNPDMAKDAALSEVVKGLARGGSMEKYDAVQVLEPDLAFSLLSTPVEQLVVGEASRGKPVTVAAPELAFLQLACDAPDVHPVDGLPEIKADGTSVATITVRKLDGRGEPRTSRNDNDEIYVRTTAGTILGPEGKGRIASLKLKQGTGSFLVLSETVPRVATVSALTADPAVRDASIRVEFI